MANLQLLSVASAFLLAQAQPSSSYSSYARVNAEPALAPEAPSISYSSYSTATANGNGPVAQTKSGSGYSSFSGKGGALRVCTVLSAPGSFFDESGQLVGMDVDIMTTLARYLGVGLEFEFLDFDKIWLRPNEGLCDISAADMTITEWRREEGALWSFPYFQTDIVLITQTGAPNTLEEVCGASGSLAVLEGSTLEKFAIERGVPRGCSVITYPSTNEGLDAVRSGEATAQIQDGSSAAYLLRDDSTVSVGERFFTGDQYGFVTQKSQKGVQLMRRVNDNICRIFGNGEYDVIFRTYYGSSFPQAPAPIGCDYQGPWPPLPLTGDVNVKAPRPEPEPEPEPEPKHAYYQPQGKRGQYYPKTHEAVPAPSNNAYAPSNNAYAPSNNAYASSNSAYAPSNNAYYQSKKHHPVPEPAPKEYNAYQPKDHYYPKVQEPKPAPAPKEPNSYQPKDHFYVKNYEPEPAPKKEHALYQPKDHYYPKKQEPKPEPEPKEQHVYQPKDSYNY